jgi:hypothetical protein
MRRMMLLTVMLALLLALVMGSPRAPRVVKAADQCEDCLAQVESAFEECLNTLGQNAQVCYDLFNDGIVACYATVCEQ